MLTRRETVAAIIGATTMVASGGKAGAAGRERIDTVLRRGIERGRIAGVVAVAATERGLLYEGAFGRRSVTSNDAMTLDTVFWIASMTKAVTTTAALQLVEQGKLSLHAPAGDVLPELRALQVPRSPTMPSSSRGAPRVGAMVS